MDLGMLPSETVPLSAEQRNRLRVNAVRPAIFALVLVVVMGGVLAWIQIRLGGHPVVHAVVWVAVILLLLVCAVVALHVRNNLLDAREGVAHVMRATLRDKRASSEAPHTFYAEFEGMRSLIVEGDAYDKLQNGRRYRVVYSPRTRRCWAVEEVH